MLSKEIECSHEWRYISMDATMKICLKVMGQESYRASKERRQAAPFPDEVALRRVPTVRGRSGAVLLPHAPQGPSLEARPHSARSKWSCTTSLQGEASEQIVEALQENFTDSQLRAVRRPTVHQKSCATSGPPYVRIWSP